MKEITKSHSKLKRILTFPMIALRKARDMYVDSMNSFADRGMYSGASFGPSAAGPLPRSFSATSNRSSDVDLTDLIRAASSRAYVDKLDLNALDSHRNTVNNTKSAARVPRSASVSMAKIEEDKPCEIGEDEIDSKKKGKKTKSGLFSKSRSYAVWSATTNKFDR